MENIREVNMEEKGLRHALLLTVFINILNPFSSDWEVTNIKVFCKHIQKKGNADRWTECVDLFASKNKTA